VSERSRDGRARITARRSGVVEGARRLAGGVPAGTPRSWSSAATPGRETVRDRHRLIRLRRPGRAHSRCRTTSFFGGVEYARLPGPLETAPQATLSRSRPRRRLGARASRLSSREYNRHGARLLGHEAMPGHTCSGSTPAGSRLGHRDPGRAAVGGVHEGGGGRWAVYANGVMAKHEYPGAGDPRAVRMQSSRAARMTINAILAPDPRARHESEARPWR